MNRLGPSLGDRIARLVHPPTLRTVRARRVLAAALALLAVALAFRGDPGREHVTVVAASRDLAPGVRLDVADVRLTEIAAGDAPTGALTDLDAALGHILAGAARTGEVFTDTRLLGPRLAEVSAGTTDARIVPIRLADNAVAGLLRVGDRVDVVAAGPDVGPGDAAVPETLGADVAVVLVSEAGTGRSTDRMVLVAMPAAQSVQVAAASLTSTLTVVFH
ncbi:MAG TPA: SAF domain-containing protein [Aldersonia sp.]